jgi:peptide/nickel transport system permease protein
MNYTGEIASSERQRLSRKQVLVVRDRTLTFIRQLWSNYKSRIGIIILGTLVMIGIVGPFIAPYSPYDISFKAWQPPSSAHLLGTDYEGADILSQFLVGTSTSLYVGVTVAIAAAGIGTLVGVITGYFGRMVDEVLMRFVDILLVIPGFPLLVLLSAYFPPTLNTTILILSILSWPVLSRIIRSQVLTVKQRPYVLASKLSGYGSFRIIYRDILPNILPLIFINIIFLVVGAVVAQAGLAFFGLGDLRSVNWGTMLYWFDAEDGIVFNAWWWLLPPGIGIVLLGLGGNLLSNGLHEVTQRRGGR